MKRPMMDISKRMKNNQIPKIIHQIWIGGEMPDILKVYTNEWKKMRGWDYKLWSNNDLHKDNFPITWNLIKKGLCLEKPIYAMIADLMRLEILYHHGGVYLDTTFEKVKNLNTLLEKRGYKFVMSNEIPDPDLKLRYISNSFIASVPHYVVLKRLLRPKKLSEIDIHGRTNKQTGPYYVRSGIKRYILIVLLNGISMLCAHVLVYLEKRGSNVILILEKHITSNIHVVLILVLI
jgi:mannosyltransferase OCH1-like enzyme